MPSEWKFEIESLEEVESLLAQKGLKKALEEKLVDVYYETSFNSTLKIRIFSNLNARTIFFRRDDKGQIKDLKRADFDNFALALNSLGSNQIERLRLEKTVISYSLNQIKITLHKIINNRNYLCFEGSNSAQILELISFLNLKREQSIALSFDEMFKV